MRPAYVVGFSWMTFFVLWTLFILGWGQGAVALGEAALSGLTATITAAGLSLLVWPLTGRVAWPDRMTPAFIGFHLGLALVFAAAWTVLGPVIGMLLEGGALADLEWDVRIYSWRLLMGVWLYVIVAGLSYASRISRRLQDERLKASRAEALAAEARLTALRSQLHPHFLFNALHSVSSLIFLDREKAVDAMELLGDLLRYAVQDRAASRVRLAEEWRFVEDYVALQTLRFGDHLKCEMTMDPVIGGVLVPPFILQPLVENAILHGLNGRPGPGVVRVDAHRIANALELVVEDDGLGFDPTEEKQGSGLKNLRSRLDALYSGRASLHIAQRETSGTHVCIHIPNPDRDGPS